VAVHHPEWISDPRLSRFAPISERQDFLKTELQEIFATKDTAEWLEILREADVPADYINTVEQFMKDPQLLPENNDMVAEWKDPVLGAMKGAKSPIKASETPPEIKGPAPLLGQDSIDILGSLGFSEQDIAALAR
jgi:formyl-CoA transferase